MYMPTFSNSASASLRDVMPLMSKLCMQLMMRCVSPQFVYVHVPIGVYECAFSSCILQDVFALSCKRLHYHHRYKDISVLTWSTTE
jgi:hypothetical protein